MAAAAAAAATIATIAKSAAAVMFGEGGNDDEEQETEFHYYYYDYGEGDVVSASDAAASPTKEGAMMMFQRTTAVRRFLVGGVFDASSSATSSSSSSSSSSHKSYSSYSSLLETEETTGTNDYYDYPDLPSEHEEDVIYTTQRVTGVVGLICGFVMAWMAWRRRRATYHRLHFGMALHIILMSVWNIVSINAVPSDTPHVYGKATGTTQSCSAAGFFAQFTTFGVGFYYVFLSIYSYVAVSHNFKHAKYKWVEQWWTHLVVHLFPAVSAVYLLTIEAYNYTGTGCWIASIPLGCGDDTGVECERGPQNISIVTWVWAGLPVFFVLLIPLVVMASLYVHVRRKQERIRIRASKVATQAGLYLLALYWTYIFSVIRKGFDIFGHNVPFWIFFVAEFNLQIQGLWFLLIYRHFTIRSPSSGSSGGRHQRGRDDPHHPQGSSYDSSSPSSAAGGGGGALSSSSSMHRRQQHKSSSSGGESGSDDFDVDTNKLLTTTRAIQLQRNKNRRRSSLLRSMNYSDADNEDIVETKSGSVRRVTASTELNTSAQQFVIENGYDDDDFSESQNHSPEEKEEEIMDIVVESQQDNDADEGGDEVPSTMSSASHATDAETNATTGGSGDTGSHCKYDKNSDCAEHSRGQDSEPSKVREEDVGGGDEEIGFVDNDTVEQPAIPYPEGDQFAHTSGTPRRLTPRTSDTTAATITSAATTAIGGSSSVGHLAVGGNNSHINAVNGIGAVVTPPATSSSDRDNGNRKRMRQFYNSVVTQWWLGGGGDGTSTRGNTLASSRQGQQRQADSSLRTDVTSFTALESGVTAVDGSGDQTPTITPPRRPRRPSGRFRRIQFFRNPPNSGSDDRDAERNNHDDGTRNSDFQLTMSGDFTQGNTTHDRKGEIGDQHTRLGGTGGGGRTNRAEQIEHRQQQQQQLQQQRHGAVSAASFNIFDGSNASGAFASFIFESDEAGDIDDNDEDIEASEYWSAIQDHI